jgi:hypothetical protein
MQRRKVERTQGQLGGSVQLKYNHFAINYYLIELEGLGCSQEAYQGHQHLQKQREENT